MASPIISSIPSLSGLTRTSLPISLAALSAASARRAGKGGFLGLGSARVLLFVNARPPVRSLALTWFVCGSRASKSFEEVLTWICSSKGRAHLLALSFVPKVYEVLTFLDRSGRDHFHSHYLQRAPRGTKPARHSANNVASLEQLRRLVTFTEKARGGLPAHISPSEEPPQLDPVAALNFRDQGRGTPQPLGHLRLADLALLPCYAKSEPDSVGIVPRLPIVSGHECGTHRRFLMLRVTKDRCSVTCSDQERFQYLSRERRL